jgi:hypothetical protein
MDILKSVILTSLLAISAGAQAESVQDLSGWQTDGDGIWAYSESTNTWSQSQNTNGGAFLYEDSGNALGKAVSGTITVKTTGDDDWIGFALGYNQGDDVNNNADYFLLTWKQADQSNFSEGLRLWHVTGAFNLSYLVDGISSSNIKQISQSRNYNDTGWLDFVDYNFDLTYEKSAMGIFINESLEYALTPDAFGLTQFHAGSFAFFNASQGGASFGSVLYDDINNVLDIEQQGALASEVPLGGAFAGLALAGLFGFRKRND